MCASSAPLTARSSASSWPWPRLGGGPDAAGVFYSNSGSFHPGMISANPCSLGCRLRRSPPSNLSWAENTLPVETHSIARLIPTTRGKNQLEQASGMIPRRANTKPMRASSAARRTSIGSVIVAPTPTAGPLIAAITGLVDRKTRNVN